MVLIVKSEQIVFQKEKKGKNLGTIPQMLFVWFLTKFTMISLNP